MSESKQLNVLGNPIKLCSGKPLTGFFRNGCCHFYDKDHGSHIVCAIMNEEFLKFSKEKGNDLTTPQPAFHFPGLKPGDRWCLCALRWVEALRSGVIAKIDLEATHESILKYVSLETLVLHAEPFCSTK